MKKILIISDTNEEEGMKFAFSFTKGKSVSVNDCKSGVIHSRGEDVILVKGIKDFEHVDSLIPVFLRALRSDQNAILISNEKILPGRIAELYRDHCEFYLGNKSVELDKFKDQDKMDEIGEKLHEILFGEITNPTVNRRIKKALLFLAEQMENGK